MPEFLQIEKSMTETVNKYETVLIYLSCGGNLVFDKLQKNMHKIVSGSKKINSLTLKRNSCKSIFLLHKLN